MSKDPLLAIDFFSIHHLASSKLTLAYPNEEELDKLINRHIYPHLISNQHPTYYQNGHTIDELNKFVYKRAGSIFYTDNFIILQDELRLTINRIKNWSEINNIEEAESLSRFFRKLEQPSDGMTLLYSDGKKLLEKIAIFLHSPLIQLEERKNIIVNLLADNELEHCIAGCYSRIASAALQLEANLEGSHQIKQWLSTFSKDMASNLAAKRPFAVPDSYQVLICKASQSAVLQNLLHAHNYLLMQAKEHGFPVLVEKDSGAIELSNKLTQLSKSAITNAYLKELEQHITATNLVDYLANKLYANFHIIMQRDITYVDKTNLIVGQLNLLGEDSWFKKNLVGLEEIMDENGQLKPITDLKITITQRLLSKKILQGYESKKIRLVEGKYLEYYEFSSAIELTWVLINGKRKSLLQLIKTDELTRIIPLPNQIKQDLFPEFTTTFIPTQILILHAIFVKNTQSLLTILKNLPHAYHEFFLNDSFSVKIVAHIKDTSSVRLFVELLSHISDKASKVFLIANLGDAFIHTLIADGLSKADIRKTLPGLSITYSIENYDANSKREALSVTKELIKHLIDNDYKNFSKIIFSRLMFKYLDKLNLRGLNFKNTIFDQSIQGSNFDEADLKGSFFNENILDLSFRKIDLRETFFQSTNDNQYVNLDFHDAQLSTHSFKNLRKLGILNFVGANLQEVNFQDLEIKNNLKFLDFSKANLEACNLSQLSLLGLKIWDANLANTDLRKTQLPLLAINRQTNLQGSRLEVSTLKHIYNLGFRNFNTCKIEIDIDFIDEGRDPFNFYRARFKNAEFYGVSFFAHFVESDLSSATFRSMDNYHNMFLSLKAIKSVLEGVTFKNINFIENTRFRFYTLNQVAFENVEMPAKILFVFYQAGIRDFSGVKSLKGPLPQKLSAYPVWNAILPKKVFLDLFKLGLRNFSGGDLNSFYLSQVLSEKAISKINLKFANYKASPLSCSLNRRIKRQTEVLICSAHILLQKFIRKNQNILSLDDIEVLATSPTKNLIIKELIIENKPLYFLQQVDEANFYLGYSSDAAVLYQAVTFAENIISTITRNTLKINFYFAKPISHANNFIIGIQFLKKLGFSDIAIHYFDMQQNYYSLNLRNGVTSMDLGENLNFKKVVTQNLIVKKVIQHKEKMLRQLLRRISLDVKKKIGSGRLSGHAKGAQYDLGAMILFFISESLSKTSTSESISLDVVTKAQLKGLVENFAQEIGRTRGADASQIQSTIVLANRCIDQGQCSTEELLIKDIVDSMYRMRPDLEIGNDYARKKIVEFFVDIGDFFSQKFSELKLEIEKIFIHENLPRVSFLSDNQIINNGSFHLNTSWNQPILMEFINNIESTFIELGYDLEEDTDFSEIRLIEVLNILCNNFTQYENSNGLTAENMTRFLQDKDFFKQISDEPEQLQSIDFANENDEDYINDFIQDSLNFNLSLTHPLDQSFANRSKRAVALAIENQQLREDQAWQIADNYLSKNILKKTRHSKSGNITYNGNDNKKHLTSIVQIKNHSNNHSSFQKNNLKKEIFHVNRKSVPQRVSKQRCNKIWSNPANDCFKLHKNQVRSSAIKGNNFVNLKPIDHHMNKIKSYIKPNEYVPAMKNNRTLKKLGGSFDQARSSNGSVTERSEIINTLFFLKFLSNCQYPKNYRPKLNEKTLKGVMRQNEKLQKKFFNK